MALRRLQLLRVLLGLGERVQVVLELLADGGFDSRETSTLEDDREAGADLHPPDDLVLGRLHRERRAELLDDLVDGRRALSQAVGADALPDLVAVVAIELLGQLVVEPLRLPDPLAQLLLDLAELLDLLVRPLERFEQLL